MKTRCALQVLFLLLRMRDYNHWMCPTRRFPLPLRLSVLEILTTMGSSTWQILCSLRGCLSTRSSDVGYNALMDMDSNGTIDVADFLLFVDVFDTTCEQQPPPPPTVHIQDANLRAVIEDSLSKASGAPITPSEMASLTRLEAPNSNISDLTGLEFATGLTVLDLGYEVVE